MSARKETSETQVNQPEAQPPLGGAAELRQTTGGKVTLYIFWQLPNKSVTETVGRIEPGDARRAIDQIQGRVLICSTTNPLTAETLRTKFGVKDGDR